MYVAICGAVVFIMVFKTRVIMRTAFSHSLLLAVLVVWVSWLHGMLDFRMSAGSRMQDTENDPQCACHLCCDHSVMSHAALMYCSTSLHIPKLGLDHCMGLYPISLSVPHGAIYLLPLHEARKEKALCQSAIQSLLLACQDASILPAMQVLELVMQYSRVALLASLCSKIIRCLNHKLDQALQGFASGGISVADIDVSLTGLHVKSDYQLVQTRRRYQMTTADAMRAASVMSVVVDSRRDGTHAIHDGMV